MQDNLEQLLDEIKEVEAHLTELKKQYREQRTAGLRAAIEARNEADAMIREEMKAMGYQYNASPFKPILWSNIR